MCFLIASTTNLQHVSCSPFDRFADILLILIQVFVFIALLLVGSRFRFHIVELIDRSSRGGLLAVTRVRRRSELPNVGGFLVTKSCAIVRNCRMPIALEIEAILCIELETRSRCAYRPSRATAIGGGESRKYNNSYIPGGILDISG